MLRWLRKGLEVPETPFQRIVYSCVGVHLFLFFVACGMKSDDHMHIMVQGADAARVICVPSFMLQATRHTTRTARTKKRKKIHKKKNKRTSKKERATKKVAPPIKKRASAHRARARQTILPEELELEEEIEITPQLEPEREPEIPAAVEPAPEDDVVYVNRETYQMLAIAQALQEAIGAQWAAPAGMPAGTACQIKVTIDATGHATEFEMVQKSGVAVFDTAARQAVRAAEYPPTAWGKSVVVHFNEEFA